MAGRGAWGPRFSCSVEDAPWRSTVCPAHFNDTDRSLGFWVVSSVTWVPPHCLFPGKHPVFVTCPLLYLFHMSLVVRF